MNEQWLMRMAVASALLLSFVIAAVLFLRFAWVSPSRGRTLGAQLTLAAIALGVALLAAEALTYALVVETDAFAFTLASKRWMSRYWAPINSLGYRDDEHTGRDLDGKTVVFVVGDSIVAGMGIRNASDRFSGVLQDRLGPEWAVMNVAKNGWTTAREYAAVVSHPVTPHVVVLSYYLNDIEGAAQKARLTRPVLISRPPRYLSRVVDRSYFANFAYWRLYRLAAAELSEAYLRYQAEAFASPEVWQLHRADLLEFVAYTRERGIHLVVVAFPRLPEVAEGLPYLARVVDLFRANGVPTINVADVVGELEPRARVVSSLDSHPSEALHRIVGEQLLEPVRATAAASAGAR